MLSDEFNRCKSQKKVNKVPVDVAANVFAGGRVQPFFGRSMSEILLQPNIIRIDPDSIFKS